MSGLLGGIDIGGTKCAVTLGIAESDQITILKKERFPTPDTPEKSIKKLIETLRDMLTEQEQPLATIGISCGGPLDSQGGIILSPPNLPGWNNISIVQVFVDAFNVPVALQNDANAGALVEWLWGAGKGYDNVIFLTFGTGMGAGLILNGQLYSGTNDMAGEVGHIRLADEGPIGFGKSGSFEGFCSGGGIQRLATSYAKVALKAGKPLRFCPTEADLPFITTEKVAKSDDPIVIQIFEQVGERLGQGLAILIDILNPQRIIIGSIYQRQQELLETSMQAVLKQEALSYALEVCEILPPAMGEAIGDYAALAVAYYKQT